ncbi:hypothetical protein HanIR_Chr04g0188641 [Helianthus annuus]|nr:hypothetical protein HanIR_Chr04g0188641 [Helianthus annuus]
MAADLDLRLTAMDPDQRLTEADKPERVSAPVLVGVGGHDAHLSGYTPESPIAKGPRYMCGGRLFGPAGPPSAVTPQP